MAIGQRKSISTDRKKNLIAHYSPESLVSNQFRSIRTNINFLTTIQSMSTLLITSPNDGEGKSTTAANLAISMSQQKTILLIDANLRKPTVHLSFKIPNTIGLTSVLANLESLDNAIHKSEIPQLDLLPSGPVSPFPSELLASKRLENLLEIISKSYDYVLIDSPSILGAVDTKVLANRCDGVILVANSGKTGLKQTLEAKKVLDFANSNIVGVILNER
ncbi:capsular exopolysaccharide synthesis family protein [Bacillus niacini]|uniref:non-specific protein-tyrosine kinase n=1 Tax=Neobacillus niacini TaxID=86668 RepID=A0A852T7N2_9BACI|nr:CpsD/CapB family tyrosine-protein kinase [Neobacillus niacini]NYE03846.1 capsular exopolysaccharide synthesis family protein [Neobacillus niacini]